MGGVDGGVRGGAGMVLPIRATAATTTTAVAAATAIAAEHRCPHRRGRRHRIAATTISVFHLSLYRGYVVPFKGIYTVVV